MAVDEAILEAVERGDVPPTLRLYAWSPPALSLGYAQSYADVDEAALREHGWSVVRRMTGGRAILHTDELTYAVIAPADEPRVAGTVLESYQLLASALLDGLNRLAVPARAEEKYAVPSGTDPKGPVCFEVPSNWEITVDGKKLIGSAQKRRKLGVLQHGSVPLVGDLTRITHALAFDTPEQRTQAAERLLARATTIENALGRAVSWEEAAAAWETAFAQTLNLTLERAALAPNEIARTKELTTEKYAHDSWTKRV